MFTHIISYINNDKKSFDGYVTHKINTVPKEPISVDFWKQCFGYLYTLNQRDALIFLLLSHGTLNIAQIVDLHCDNIRWKDNSIVYEKTLSNYTTRYTLFYPKNCMLLLKKYIDTHSITDYIFVTRTQNKVTVDRTSHVFKVLKSVFNKTINARVLKQFLNTKTWIIVNNYLEQFIRE